MSVTTSERAPTNGQRERLAAKFGRPAVVSDASGAPVADGIEPDSTLIPPAVIAPDVYGGDLRAFLGDEEPDEDDSKDWLIRGLMPRAVPWTAAGQPKTGKTLIVEDQAIAIASGAEDWCGFAIPEDIRGARVLVMPREDSERETRVRLWRLARGRGLDPRELAGKLEVDPTSPLYLDDPKHVDKLRRSVARFDLALIDSLSTVHRADENSAKEMAAISGTWRDVALTTGTSLGIVHHFNGKGMEGDKRSPGNKLRGSSAIFAAVRHVVGMERLKEPENTLAIRTEGNLYYQPEPFAVRLVKETLETGKVAFRYELIGELDAVKHAVVDDAIIVALTAATEGLGTVQLRDAVRDSLHHAGNEMIDSRARALSRAGRISRATPRSPWRLS